MKLTGIVMAAALVLTALSWVVLGRGFAQRRGIAFLAAWFVPGMGHALLGKWRKGLFMFGLLAGTYAFGLWLSGWRTVSFDDNPFYNVGQYGSGMTMLLGGLLGDPKAFPRDDVPKSWYDPGLLYCCVTGLLNLVIMLSVFEVKAPEAGKPEAPAPQGSPGAGA